MQYTVDLWFVERRDAALANGLYDALWIESILRGNLVQSGDASKNNAVSKFESLWKRALKRGASRRVGARLKDCPDFVSRITMAQSKNGLSNRCRMMAKIINDLNSVDFPPKFLTPRHAAEACQRISDAFRRQPVGEPDRNGHGCVSNVEFTDQRYPEGSAIEHEFRSRTRVIDLSDAVGAGFAKADGENPGGSARDDIQTIWIVSVYEDRSSAWHNVDEASKAKFDLFKIREDVSVIELDIVDYHCFRQVVEELRALIEERRIVFVSFNQEVF